MTITGKFSTMSMPDLVQWARTAQRSGTLHLRDGHGKEIHVGFADGRIIFSATNAARETYGAYLLHLGLCGESDIGAALAAAKRTGAMFAAVLVQDRKLSRQQAIDTLTEKTIEDLCDAFLWPDGEFHFTPGRLEATQALAINLDPIRVVVEGVSRAEVWSRITAIIHPTSFFEPTDEPFLDDGEWEDVLMARRVYALLDGNESVQDVADRLPFGRYKVYRAISELLEKKLLRPCDVTGVVDREKRLQRIINAARGAAVGGRWTEAIETLKGLASANPGRMEVTEALLDVTSGYRAAVFEHHFSLDDVPVVTIGPDALSHMDIHPTDAFLLSRVDGRLTLRQIIQISPIAEVDALRTFTRLLAARVVDFPRRTTEQPTSAPA